ncbi:hypothetical protein CAPTEDRAFT_227878 [Capitella teleta]|uniref:MARVEL domain-containing protein n=1 Tax=Capitella teleta TaxID=283909 RepID=R7UZ10_CAPTE|nr:hypothetical protein CAPTEDRAFT_227878 [Capitella teleta]|eukprot:ELU08641.1 hypothetical protein CAPTEDRAFT_227878 [Capitella teleta]
MTATLVFSLIAFMCVTIGAVVCVPYVATTGFFNFVAMAALLSTLCLYAILLFKVQERIFRCNCCQWPLLEAGYYGVVLVLYFFAVLFLSLHGCVTSHKVGAAFGSFAVLVYAADGALALRRFLAWRREHSRPPATIEGGVGGGPMGAIATTDMNKKEKLPLLMSI